MKRNSFFSAIGYFGRIPIKGMVRLESKQFKRLKTCKNALQRLMHCCFKIRNPKFYQKCIQTSDRENWKPFFGRCNFFFVIVTYSLRVRDPMFIRFRIQFFKFGLTEATSRPGPGDAMSADPPAMHQCRRLNIQRSGDLN